jgi:predicted CXXCH cytochrome family protein
VEVNTVKRFSLVALLALVVVLGTASAAFANFGPHGGYATDTDACAGCHRAHTSYSTLGWTDQQGGDRTTALLVSNASSMTEFCYACHGNAAPGAGTNVQSGVFDSGPTTAGGATPNGTTTFSKSFSTANAPLNGGGFEKVGGTGGSAIQSSHMMDPSTSNTALSNILIKWGNANLAPMSNFTCTDCHDPHGSTNYRLLKDQLAGAGDMTNFVISNEKNFPVTGFRRGPDGVTDIADYVPNYTSAYYAKSAANKGISAWCAGCHTVYNNEAGGLTGANSTYDYAGGTTAPYTGANPNGSTNFAPGAKVFHRHLLGVALDPNMGTVAQGRALNVPVKDDAGLPLEMGVGTFNRDASPVGTDGEFMLAKSWDGSGFINCLTCHQAHGNASTMSGWALSVIGADGYPTRVAGSGVQEPAGHGRVTDAIQGTNVNFSESILRFPNRGVCERCHDK